MGRPTRRRDRRRYESACGGRRFRGRQHLGRHRAALSRRGRRANYVPAVVVSGDAVGFVAAVVQRKLRCASARQRRRRGVQPLLRGRDRPVQSSGRDGAGPGGQSGRPAAPPTSPSPATIRCATTARATASCSPPPAFPSRCTTPRRWCTATSATPGWCPPRPRRWTVVWPRCARRCTYGDAMTEPTTARPQIDPTLKALVDAFPMTFKASDGVEVARARLRQLKAPPEMLPDLRIENRTAERRTRPHLLAAAPSPATCRSSSSTTAGASRWATWKPMTRSRGHMPSAPTRSWCPSTTGWRPSTRSRPG